MVSVSPAVPKTHGAEDVTPSLAHTAERPSGTNQMAYQRVTQRRPRSLAPEDQIETGT